MLILNILVNLPILTFFQNTSFTPITEEVWIVAQKTLEETPYVKMNDVPKTFNTLLWASQADTILKYYNKQLNASWNDNFLSANFIHFPLIYPELRNYFPENITWLAEKVSFNENEKKNLENKDVIIVLHTDLNKSALAYYENQKLKLSTFVSLWKIGSKTKDWVYKLKHDKIFRRSWMFNWDPMPYALQYSWPYFIHRWVSDWTYLSHWCVRVPWLYQKWLYEYLPKDNQATIIIHKPYEISLYSNKNTTTNND